MKRERTSGRGRGCTIYEPDRRRRRSRAAGSPTCRCHPPGRRGCSLPRSAKLRGHVRTRRDATRDALGTTRGRRGSTRGATREEARAGAGASRARDAGSRVDARASARTRPLAVIDDGCLDERKQISEKRGRAPRADVRCPRTPHHKTRRTRPAATLFVRRVYAGHAQALFKMVRRRHHDRPSASPPRRSRRRRVPTRVSARVFLFRRPRARFSRGRHRGRAPPHAARAPARRARASRGAIVARVRRAAPSPRILARASAPAFRRDDGIRLGSGRDPRGARPHQTPPPTPTLTPPPSTAVPKDFQDQEDPGQEAEAEPPHPPVDPHAHGQHHQVRLEPPDEAHKSARSAAWTLAAFFRVRGPRPRRGSPPVHRSPARIAPRSLPTRTVALTLLSPSSFRYNAKRRHWRRTKLGLKSILLG